MSREITTVNLGRFRGRYRLAHRRAVIFIPEAAAVAAAARCLECADANRLVVVGVVVGDWHAVEDMLRDRTVTIVIVDSRTDLPPDREPRLIIVAEQPPRCGRRMTRTSRITRRDAAT